MYQFQIELGQEETPSCLPVVQLLGSSEVCQVLVIGEDGDWVLGAEQVMPPGFQGMDDAEEFAIIDFIIPLGRVKGM